jgi:hypothetical protein
LPNYAKQAWILSVSILVTVATKYNLEDGIDVVSSKRD